MLLHNGSRLDILPVLRASLKATYTALYAGATT